MSQRIGELLATLTVSKSATIHARWKQTRKTLCGRRSSPAPMFADYWSDWIGSSARCLRCVAVAYVIERKRMRA